MSFWYFLGGLVFGAGLGIAGYFLWRALRLRRLGEALGLALLLIKIPRTRRKGDSGSAEKEFKFEINKFEQLLSNLLALRKPVVFEAAVPHVGEEIHFYLAVPKEHVEIAAKQIQGIWSGASVSESEDDYNIFNVSGAATGAYLKQAENFALPVRTYAELEIDTFSSILGAFTKVNEVGEGAALQVVLRPADKELKKTGIKYLEALKKGEPAEKVFGGFFKKNLSTLAASPKREEEKKLEPKIVDEDAAKSLEAKISKPLFQVNIRLLASAPSQFQANDILEGLLAGFKQFGSPRRNEFRAVKSKNASRLAYQFIYRKFEPGQAMVLNSEEIASLYHFPIPSTETPRVKWLKAKEAEPPPNLPAAGVLLGRSSFRGQSRPVYLTEEDRRRHLYVVGQTGTGKSTMMANMLIEDIRTGRGVGVIDPHGELIASIMAHIPRERLEDVIYFNPGDIWRPLGLNMLDHHLDRPEEKTFIVNEMQSIFNRLFLAETMGPMFEQYMRNALLLLMEDMAHEPATLIEVPRVFTDSEYRRRKLARISNPVVIDFWEKEAIKAGGEASLANMTPYITSKFNNFIANDYVRPIIGQPKSAFNFREVMDEGRILLVNLSKGRIGDINAGLLGMIMTGKLLMAALSRVDLNPERRQDFYLYIDEFQNFTTDSIATILSEARKYRLDLIMAHQFIAQLEEKIRDAVFGNVGSLAVFRVGVQDAEFLVKQFEPVFDENDLISIDNLNAYVRLLIQGETSRPFNLKIETTSWQPGDKSLAEKILEYSRLKYGADRQEVEARILERLRA